MIVPDPKGHRFYVHLLVLKNFIGEPPFGFCAHFKDRDKDNTALANLKWRPKTKAGARCYKLGRPHIPDDVARKVMRLCRKKKTKALRRLLSDLDRR